MEENTNTVLDANQQPQEVPQLIKTLSIFTYIFSAIYIILGILVMVASGLVMNMFGSMGLGEASTATGIIVVVGIVIIGFEIMTIAGATKMRKGKKSGYILWIIPNALWILMTLYTLFTGGAVSGAGFWLGFLITIGMTIGYTSQLKALK